MALPSIPEYAVGPSRCVYEAILEARVPPYRGKKFAMFSKIKKSSFINMKSSDMSSEDAAAYKQAAMFLNLLALSLTGMWLPLNQSGLLPTSHTRPSGAF